VFEDEPAVFCLWQTAFLTHLGILEMSVKADATGAEESDEDEFVDSVELEAVVTFEAAVVLSVLSAEGATVVEVVVEVVVLVVSKLTKLTLLYERTH